MSSLLQLKNGEKAYGSKILFDRATFAVNEGEHLGVIGPNGAGKTTLFKTLVGEEELDRGDIVQANHLRIGYLKQHSDIDLHITVEDFLADGSYKPIWEIKRLGRNLGIAPDHHGLPLMSLSGGYQMRCKLLKLIGQEANLLLLDEPTNYLDLETVLILENTLQSFQGAFMLISHDREFLKRTTDHTLEVEGGDIVKYPGNIEDYFEQKELMRTQLIARANSLDQKRKEILDFVARFGAKASKASQAQSRLKRLDKMESIQIKDLAVQTHIRIPDPVRVGKIVVELDRVELGYPGKTILKNVELKILAGDHLVILGLNGVGKSTLLKGIAGVLEPKSGKRTLGYQVDIGYYAQHVSEGLDLDQTVLEALSEKAHPSVSKQEVLDLAGSLLFSGKEVHKKISILSGGERARVALGTILLSKASCLVLDEPTNHLDFQTVEALTVALSKYPGTFIVVSHDRSFVQRVGKKMLEISNGQMRLYPGTYEEYVWSVQKSQINTEPEESPAKTSKKIEVKKSLEQPLPKKKLETIEKSLSNAQLELDLLNKKMMEDPKSIHRESMNQMRQLQKLIETLESEWFTLQNKK